MGSGRPSILTLGVYCMYTYRPSHNMSLTQHPYVFPVFAVDQCEIFELMYSPITLK